MSKPPRTAIRHPRLAAFQLLLQDLSAGRSIWTGFLERLPLTLGESTVDRVVPYSVSDDVHRAFSGGVEGLVDLLRRRRDPAYDREKQSALLPDERQRVVLWPRRFCPRTIPDDDPSRGVVRLALLETPELDGGLLESWLSRQAGGRDLFETLVGLLAKSLRMAFRFPASSGVGLMAHLAALNTLLAAKEHIKQSTVKNLPYARLDRAIGLALHACFRQAFDTAVASVGRPPAGSPEHTDLMVALVGLGPLTFLSIQNAELTEDINPYGLSPEVEQLLTPPYQAELEHGNQPRSLLEGMLRGVLRQGPLRASLLQHAACEAFRRLALDHLVAGEDPAIETDQLLSYCFGSNSGILDVIENSALLGQMATDLGERLADRRRRESAARAMQHLLGMVERLRDRGPPWKQPSESDELALQDLVERFLLHRMDEFARGRLAQARLRVVDRRPSNTTADLKQEYETGRLYRFSTDDLPLVRARVVHEEAQLFVDLKGYTRRTAQAKELVMAEFLKTEFYEPILQAAKRYHTGAQLVAREHDIALTNLLGDAVAFSGDIVSLVDLAHDIQDIFRAYRNKLLQLAQGADSEIVEAARREVAQRREAIGAERKRLGQELQEVKQEIFDRSSLDIGAMVKQLQQDYQDQFDRILVSYRSLQKQESGLRDTAQRAQLAVRIEGIRHAHQKLKEHRELTLKRLKLLKGEDLTEQLTDLLGRRLLERVREIEGRIRALLDEEQNLDEAEEQDRHRRGAGLEAGLFISHGAAAEVITMLDDAWGEQRVAVSERINEAARGTARNLVVKQHVDELLASARKERNNPALELPFRVYIASTGTFRIEPKLGRMWHQAVTDQDPDLLAHFLAELEILVRARFTGAEDVTEDTSALQGHDMYNLGEAMSAGALDAYLRQTRTSHEFFRIQIRPSELHAEIQQRFLFLQDMLNLIVGFSLKDEVGQAEMFRYVGQILFRGFEGTRPTPVYEILRPESPFVRMLRKHHLNTWLLEARQNPECKLEGLNEPIDPDDSEPPAQAQADPTR